MLRRLYLHLDLVLVSPKLILDMLRTAHALEPPSLHHDSHLGA